MKIAIVHDWLVNFGGAERVLEQMLRCFPDADLFSLTNFLSEEDQKHILHKNPTTTFIQKLPFARKRYRSYLPFMPLAIEQLDMSGYDLVISSSHAVAKGVITGPAQTHICMCYSPIRYAWDFQHQYLRESSLEHGLKSWLARWILHKIRIWDARTANGVDEFIAISKFIQRRIKKVYGRSSHVIYPPVDTDFFNLCDQKENFYLTASRMVQYKRMDLIVEAFSKMPQHQLVVIGDGPDFAKVAAKAGPNTKLLGYQSAEILRQYMKQAKAFVFAAEEDFGIAPIEAQACGTPVIAFGKGATLETIIGLNDHLRDGVLMSATGVFFEEQTVQSLIGAVEMFESSRAKIRSIACRENALRFSTERFVTEFKDFVMSKLSA